MCDIDTSTEAVEAQAAALDYRQENGGELLRALSAERDALQKELEGIREALDEVTKCQAPTLASRAQTIYWMSQAKLASDSFAALRDREMLWVELYELLGSDWTAGSTGRIEELEKLLGIDDPEGKSTPSVPIPLDNPLD